MTPPLADAPLREADVLDLLDRHYAVGSTNPRYVGARHVHNHAGFNYTRTVDYMAVDCWPSKGLPVHGHEVKVSRSDWLRELADPDKAGAFLPFMSFWWLVVSDAAIVRSGELPAGWGLLVVDEGRLAVASRARRRTAEPMPWPMVTALVRASAKSAAARAGGAA